MPVPLVELAWVAVCAVSVGIWLRSVWELRSWGRRRAREGRTGAPTHAEQAAVLDALYGAPDRTPEPLEAPYVTQAQERASVFYAHLQVEGVDPDTGKAYRLDVDSINAQRRHHGLDPLNAEDIMNAAEHARAEESRQRGRRRYATGPDGERVRVYRIGEPPE